MTKEKGGVTAPTEPLKLTPAELEEAAAAVEDLYRWNEVPTPPLVGKLRRLAQGAAEDAEPAAARDDAAELRATLVKVADLVFTIASADEELSFPHYEDSERTQAYLQLQRAARKAAWESLQELAAEYDGVPALAATEGQP